MQASSKLSRAQRQWYQWYDVCHGMGKIGLALIGLIFFGAARTLPAAEATSQPTGQANPLRGQIIAVIRKELGNKEDYKPGDLLSQKDIEPIMNELNGMGIRPSDHEETYDAVLPDNDRLVALFNTPEGKKFVRQVSRQPLAYDRLERLTWTHVGQEFLQALVDSADGPKRFEKMCQPEGLKQMEAVLSAEPRGKNFSLPTGMIHTADDLLQRLCDRMHEEP